MGPVVVGGRLSTDEAGFRFPAASLATPAGMLAVTVARGDVGVRSKPYRLPLPWKFVSTAPPTCTAPASKPVTGLVKITVTGIGFVRAVAVVNREATGAVWSRNQLTE